MAMRLILIGAIGTLIVAVASCADTSSNALRSNDGIPIFQPSGGFGSPSPAPC